MSAESLDAKTPKTPSFAENENFGLRWQSTAATPLWGASEPGKAAWRSASRRSPKRFFAALGGLRASALKDGFTESL